MTPARRSPSTRTLGIQFVEMSTVLALMARMFRTASSPMPVIATSRNATTATILVRMEYLASMGPNLLVLGVRGARRMVARRRLEDGGCLADIKPDAPSG